jgi:toxin CcdB
MSQFDILANPFPRSRERQPYLVNLQSDILARDVDTIVVAPLERVGPDDYADRLNPQIIVDGETYIFIAQELVTVRKNVLGRPRGSLAADRDKIIAALDLLFTGV